MRNEYTPVTVEQIGAALTALGFLGDLTAAEHAEYAAQFSDPGIARVRLVNALLGLAQREAMLADVIELDDENRFAALGEQLKAVDGWDNDLAVRMAFIGWQVYRASIPLQLVARDPNSGPIPVAALNAAEGMHSLLSMIGATHEAAATGDIGAFAPYAEELKRGRELMRAAIENIEIVLNMLDSAGL
ncbi:DUF6245 family protein [Kitasatospora sp. NPDC058190]|uniref:DUF6245 family protein n=1 Tax=Kitasatospora sp. NPDC058190 TaxID=3346371 RepID=UPI0036D76722